MEGDSANREEDDEKVEEPLWILKSRFDEVHVEKSSFVVLFPFLGAAVHVNVGSDIFDVCVTHNYVVVATNNHIYIAHKDELESPLTCSWDLKRSLDLEFKPGCWKSVVVYDLKETTVTKCWPADKRKTTASVILTSTVSTVYFVYTVDDVSTVVRLFNEYSYLESGIVRPTVVQIPEDLRIVAAASGNDHSIFLTAKGSVFVLGTGSRGELGIGLVPRVCELTWLEALEGVRVISIAASGWHSAALTADGDVYVWGWNHRGQLGDEKERVELYPSPLEIDLRVVRIALQEHLTAIWVAEDKDEPSIVMGSDKIGMPHVQLQYYNHVPDKTNEQDRLGGIGGDSQVDMVFLNGNRSLGSLGDSSEIHRLQGYQAQEDKFEYVVRDRD
ncbi:hypothetical protein RB195_004541 [Necator americanus]|uniref:Regulator of condensation n=1 Tax=Necator americanus TaxID=51031 RepID=A0ABR1BK98_NECAM